MTTFCLHGFGSNAQAFRAVWEAADAVPEDAVFLDGPESDVLSGGRRWFPFTGDRARTIREVAAAAAALEVRIAPLCRVGPITLAGHSQGGMIALELACRGNLPICAVASFAAFLPDRNDNRRINGAAMRIALFGSRRDRHVPAAAITETATFFLKHGTAVVEQRLADLDHAFGPDWLRDAAFV